MCKKASHPLKCTKRNIFQEQHWCAAQCMTHNVTGMRGWTSVYVCVHASIEEMLDFTRAISPTSVNYSCVLIVWLELTKTTSSTEHTCTNNMHIGNSFTGSLIIRLKPEYGNTLILQISRKHLNQIIQLALRS